MGFVHERLLALSALLLLAAVASAQAPAPMTCTLNTANAAIFFGPGQRIGDIDVYCTGGAPPPPDSPIPTADITVLLTTAVTSPIRGPLLSVDAPSTVINGWVGAGVIYFLGVPIAAPGSAGSRHFHISNILVAATLVSTVISASVTFSAPSDVLSLPANTGVVATVLTLKSPTALAPGEVGVPYGPVSFLASGDIGSDTWTSISLPNGLAFSKTGVLSGTPAAGSQGSYNPSFVLNDSYHSSILATFPLSISAHVAIVDASLPFANAVVGVPYGPLTLAATGGTGGYSWSVTGLPNGLTLSTAGVLSGTPAAGSQGFYNPTFTVRDSAGGTDSIGRSLQVPGTHVSISPLLVTLGPNQTQQFTVTVTGPSNTAFIWGFYPQLGTLSSTGLYTAPVVTYPVTVTISALSIADHTQSASAAVFLAPPGKPDPPTNLSATPGGGQVTLNWTPSPTAGLAGTRVLRCRGMGCSGLTQIALLPGNAATYTDLDVTAGVSFTYAVQVVDNSGNQSYFSNTAFATPSGLALNPSLLAFSSPSGSVPSPQSVLVSGGIGAFSVSVPSTCSWVTPPPKDGNIPGSFSVSVSAADLTPGAYNCTLSVISQGSSQPFPVSLVVGPAFLVATPSSLSLNSNTQTNGSFTLDAGGGNVRFTAAASCGWITLSPASGVTPATVRALLNNFAAPSTLGTYPCDIWISAPAAGAALQVPLTFVVNAAPDSLYFIPLGPCHLVDTRAGEAMSGEFGPPSLGNGETRTFHPSTGGCSGIPTTAKAYSLNLTAAPQSTLRYLTIWPEGQPQPLVSTLNGFKGGSISNAAFVPAGTNGGISVFATDATDLMIDINGYFDSTVSGSALSLYAIQPCRVADTRNPVGPLGGPQMPANTSRDYPIRLSNCVPYDAGARSYSLNVTVVPAEPLGTLALWPASAPQPPLISTMSASFGDVTANATLANTTTPNGPITMSSSNRTDVILDINGYFAPPGAPGALLFHPIAPCRAADTRSTTSIAAGESRDFDLVSSACNLPSNASAYSLNVTVVPSVLLGYLSIWPAGQPQPLVSTLNSWDGRILANAAIVPAGRNGAVTVFATNPVDVILDVNGYFAAQ